VLSHEIALELYGLADVLPATTHLTVLASFRPRLHTGMTLHCEPLSPDEIALRDDLRVATVDRTIVDCFRWEPIGASFFSPSAKQLSADS
jgi:predicted transcriptional regulator of viral defense system